MQVVEVRRKFSFCFYSEKQQLHHREEKFLEVHFIAKEKRCLSLLPDTYSVQSQELKLQTKIQSEDNTFICNRLAEELFQEELAVNKTYTPTINFKSLT